MRLWLLRHGEAEPESLQLGDARRSLTLRGRQQALQSAGRLMGTELRTILVSPYVRARQTADIVASALGFTGEHLVKPWLTPDSDPLEVISQLHEADSPQLIVAHQPLLGKLAGLLISGHQQDPLALGTGALLEFSGAACAAGLMVLESHFQPD